MVWLGLCLLSAVAFGGMTMILTDRGIPAAFLAVMGLLLPIGLAIYLRNRRQTAIMTQLPGMADELARSARAGRNLEQSLLLVAGDTPAPLGDELKVSARRMEMGLDVASSVRDLADRTGVSTLTMFSSALSLHQDTGGDLIMVLERLATAVRDRLHFVARQRAATVASRWGASMMILIPFVVMMIYTVWYPNYLTQLTDSSWGRRSLWFGITGLLTGSFFVYRILARECDGSELQRQRSLFYVLHMVPCSGCCTGCWPWPEETVFPCRKATAQSVSTVSSAAGSEFTAGSGAGGKNSVRIAETGTAT